MRLLTLDDLDRITMECYSKRAPSGFDSSDHNLGGLWSWEESAFQDYLPPAGRVLVAGAGGGREMVALARSGYQVVGFDASQDLVDSCRANLGLAGVTAEALWAAPGDVPRDIGPFDALVVGRGVYHHIPRASRRVRFLSACRDQLAPGAPLLLGDVLFTEAPRKPPSGSAVEAGDHVGSAFFHRFTRDEIDSELGRAGFDLVDFRRTPFDGGTLAHAVARAR